jgi:hypothetical protein
VCSLKDANRSFTSARLNALAISPLRLSTIGFDVPPGAYGPDGTTMRIVLTGYSALAALAFGPRARAKM